MRKKWQILHFSHSSLHSHFIPDHKYSYIIKKNLKKMHIVKTINFILQSFLILILEKLHFYVGVKYPIL